jgi:hypothetical protein
MFLRLGEGRRNCFGINATTTDPAIFRGNYEENFVLVVNIAFIGNKRNAI